MSLATVVTTSIAALLLAGCASSGVHSPATTTGANAECALVVPGESSSAASGPSESASMPASVSARAAGSEGVSATEARATSGEHDTVDAVAPLTVALPGPVTPSHAPWPRDEGERLVFTQLYETLVRVDCTGRVVPGLARQWSSDSSRTLWTFVLRDGARFRNGEAVTAADVIESWRASAAAHARDQRGAAVARLAAGARALDAGTVVVTLTDSAAAPAIFADAGLAVARAADGHGWPDGTTSYYVDSGAADSGAATVGSSTASHAILLRSTRDPAPLLLFQSTEQEDARDILDAGVDVLPAATSAVARYAATLRGRAVIPLPWSRTYVLAIAPRANSSGATERRPAACDAAAPRAFRAALAAAVHADARGAEGPFWWRAESARAADAPADTALCATDAVRRAAASSRPARVDRPERDRSRRIVYQRDDATARELAERIVALAAPGREAPSPGLESVAPEMLGAASWRAVGLDSAAFARDLAAGTEPAYVIALPRHPVARSLATAMLGARASWLYDVDREGAAIVPLVDTRSSFIARRGRTALRLTVDRDGTLRFDAPPSTAERTP